MLLQTCPAGPVPRNRPSSVPTTRCHTKSPFCTGESPDPEQGVGSCTSGKVEFGQDQQLVPGKLLPLTGLLMTGWNFEVLCKVTFKALWGSEVFAGNTSSVCHLLALKL